MSVAYRFIRVSKLNTELTVHYLQQGVKGGNLIHVVYTFCSRIFIEEYRYLLKDASCEILMVSALPIGF